METSSAMYIVNSASFSRDNLEKLGQCCPNGTILIAALACASRLIGLAAFRRKRSDHSAIMAVRRAVRAIYSHTHLYFFSIPLYLTTFSDYTDYTAYTA